MHYYDIDNDSNVYDFQLSMEAFHCFPELDVAATISSSFCNLFQVDCLFCFGATVLSQLKQAFLL